MRLLRFKISKDSYKNIITNLPTSEFWAEEIRILYNLIWGIEIFFRELKYDIVALDFHSKKREYLEMEVWSSLLLYNFYSIITEHVIIRQKGRRYVYQVNYSIAYKTCHYFLKMHNGEKPPDIENQIGKNTLPIWPNRKYARQHRFWVPVSFNYHLI